MTKKTIQFLSIAFVMMLGFGGMKQSVEAFKIPSFLHKFVDPCSVDCISGTCSSKCMSCYADNLGKTKKTACQSDYNDCSNDSCSNDMCGDGGFDTSSCGQDNQDE